MIGLVQALLQKAFMRVEALFNAAFGDRLNPLYHLGTISFFLFWVVGASGLYLYAFFETGVSDAYASVESLTHRQWFAGGILRSVHRYASDALVFTMLLHLLRHFAFNRFRSFRWLSWVTGIALIWGIYASGINGYMLPWDRMGQYVTVAVFEWLDWLPGFGGTLVRNVIYPSSVNDRFFSLLTFMHIGVSLFVLLLMFVHVQRVPKARTLPPPAVMLGLLGSLFALALVRPALSQGGPADLSRAVTELRLDSWLLAIFPLLDLWSAGRVWALVAVGTALLGMLPWLPPRFRREHAGAFRMMLHPSMQPIGVRRGETLLDAGLRQGLTLPYECRNGGCGVCLCTILHGEVDYGHYQRLALPDALRAQGKALMCCATPLSDLDIEVAGQRALQARATLPVREYLARVDRMEQLSADVMRLTLTPIAHEAIDFKAGQYLNIVLDDGQRRAFSFANPPGETAHIELHVRRIPDGLFTGHVFTRMRVGDTVRFEGPLGDFTLCESARPILFVAGATGFAPVKSIVEDAFARGLTRPMILYWGVRKRADLYAFDLAEQWQRQHPNFRFVPVLSEPDPTDDWQGRTGLVHAAMLADFPDLSGHEVYVCGSIRMVDVAVPAFLAQGLDETACFSDAFMPSAAARHPSGG
ncbi:MAG: 2Fe-2S iron-sulfur cluster binding domain-containing protein [Rhodocyclaceae bacterium]|nr:2Fe-2S iron-sulfur cluster binding domain-containing protein [Rhodocyclaceae bacterium]